MSALVDIGRARRRPRTCKLCRMPGHDRRACPKTATVAPALRDNDPIGERAELRMRIDAHRIEIAEYERVRDEIETRIANSRLTLISLELLLEEARVSP